MQSVKLKLIHAFGSTCSKNYKNALVICDQQKNQPKIVFPAGKTLARKYIDRSQMDFIQFSQNTQTIQCITVLPTKTHCAVVQKPFGSNLQVIKIYSMTGKQQPHLIKIFSQVDKVGIIKQIVFSASQPKFMCAQLGQPHNKLIFIDTSRNKPLAQSNFTIKQIQKLTICPQNSHLICLSGGSTLKLYKIEQYAFKPLEDIRKFPKNRIITQHSWFYQKKILAATDKGEILIIEQVKPNIYEVRQQYHNVFNQSQPQSFIITCICPFTKGFILGSNVGKFCLWTRKQDLMNNTQTTQKLQLTRKWSTTLQRTSSVTDISINKKQDLLLISMANNDIALLYLNQIIPQVSDIIKQTTQKQINFQYLYKGFHSKPITGMDICQQRPLFATCSNQDSTIRVWNYKTFGCKLLRMFYFKIKSDTEADKPLITLSFHPSGYYMAVGCVDKLRLFHVLNNQLRPFKQVGIRKVHSVKFSHGGHLLAVGQQFSQELQYDYVRVYNALTLQQLVTFKDTQSIVKNLQWKCYDEMLSCIYENGTLIEWRVSDWSVNRKMNKKQLKFEASTYNHPTNSIMIYVQNSQKQTNSIEQYFDNNTCKSIQIDMKITKMIQLKVRKQKSYFILGLQNGTIVTFSGLQKQQISSHNNNHIQQIRQMIISPCGNYLITCGKDSLIFIYQIQIINQNNNNRRQQLCLSTVVDDFLSDVVLVNKKEIKKYTQKQKQYIKVINNLSKKLKLLSEQGEKKHLKNMSQLDIQKNRIIDDIKYRIQKIRQQIQQLKQKNNQSLNQLDSKGISSISVLQKTYQQKITFQQQKYFQLQQQLIQLKLLHSKKLQLLHKQQQNNIKQLKRQFQQKFKQSQKIFTQTKQQNNQATNIFQMRLQQIEQQQQQEIRQLQNKKYKFKLQTAAVLEELHQKLQKLKKQFNNLQKQKNQLKTQNQQLNFQKRKLQKQLNQLKEKLKDLLVDYEQKLQSLGIKQKKIIQFENKIQQLQKKKHILSYKATQMKKAIQPKDYQIQKLKNDLIKLKKQFQISLQRKQKQNLYLQKINKQKQYLNKCLQQQKSKTNHQVNLIDQIMMDIYFCLQKNYLSNHNSNNNNNSLNNKNNEIINLLGNNQKPPIQPIQQTDHKIYFKQLIKLYHKYVQSQSPSNPKSIQQHVDKNMDQVTKQIIHLQKSLYQINKSNQKNIIRKNQQIYKKTKQNTQLINNLNELKKQNKQLLLKIKSKNIEIDNLKSVKSELLNKCPQQNMNNNVMFKLINTMDQNFFNQQTIGGGGYNSVKKMPSHNNSINSYNNSSTNKPLIGRQRSIRNVPSANNLPQYNSNKISSMIKPISNLPKSQQNQEMNSINYKKKQCEIISQIQFINQRVHKYQFYLNDMIQKLKRHSNYAECTNVKALIDQLKDE